MVDKYFVNCRGATFNKVHTDEWDKSGGLPRMSTPFQPVTVDYDKDYMTFAGSTKTSNWLHWNDDEANSQLDYLSKIGVNLIRVYADLFTWDALGSRYLQSVESLAKLCNSKKMYIQWVLFDGYTQDDTPSTNHSLGYLDPSTIPEAMSWGIRRWQRCPTINENSISGTRDYFKLVEDIPSRSGSSLSPKVESYISDMLSTAGKYRSALSWEVMHDVNILDTETNAYSFLIAAINKVNSLKTANQKTTISSKYLNAYSTKGSNGTPDVYDSTLIEQVIPLLDYACELTINFTILGFINSYRRLLDFSSKTKKPFMLIDSFNESLLTPSEFFTFAKDFNVGVICEGMVDRAMSRKPNNDTKGILYDDGSCRRSVDASAVKSKASNDGIGFTKLSLPSEKTDFNNLYSKVASSFERFEAHGDFGYWTFSSIHEAHEGYPEFSGTPIGYLPMASSVSSTKNGWGVVGDGLGYGYESNYLFSSLKLWDQYGNQNFASWKLFQHISDPVERDKQGSKMLAKLIRLTQDLDMTFGHNFHNSEGYSIPSLVSFATQNNVQTYASGYLPTSLTKTSKYNKSPLVGSPKLLSNLSPSDGGYRQSVTELDKPLCYWNRPSGAEFASGCCDYSAAITVGTMDTEYTDILNTKIDWSSYDTDFFYWSAYLYNAYVEANNSLKSYLEALGDPRVSSYLVTQTPVVIS